MAINASLPGLEVESPASGSFNYTIELNYGL
jgi:hypothetical protein